MNIMILNAVKIYLHPHAEHNWMMNLCYGHYSQCTAKSRICRRL